MYVISREDRNQVVMDNLGLVYMVLKRFGGRGYEMEDLFQIGVIGLTKAADKFDESLGYAFSTYAVPLVIGEIKRFLRDDGMVHVSRQMKDYARKIAAEKEEFEKKNGVEPTIEEIANATGLTGEEILQGLEANVVVESIYAPVCGSGNDGGEKTASIGDFIVDERSSDSGFIDRLAIKQVLKRLKPEEEKLIRLRYMEGKTQSEVAQVLGTNQVAISRLEKKILLQLRSEFVYNEQG